MTFLEAAIRVLTRSKRPLHYKKITEIARSEELITEESGDSEQMMSGCLSDAVKTESESNIKRMRPGVYGLGAEEASAEESDNEISKAEPATILPDEEFPAIVLGSPAPPVEKGNAAVNKVLADRPKDENERASKAGNRRGRGRAKSSVRSSEERPSEERPSKGAKSSEKAPRSRTSERTRRKGNEPNRTSQSAAGPLRIKERSEELIKCLEQADNPMTLQSIAERLEVSDQPKLSPLQIEQMLYSTNEKAISQGYIPPFQLQSKGWISVFRTLDKEITGALSKIEGAYQELSAALKGQLSVRIKKMAPVQRLAFVEAVFSRLGFQLHTLEQGTTDLILAEDQSISCLSRKLVLQINHTKRPVDGNKVAALRGRLGRFNVDEALVVSAYGFTKTAMDEVREVGVGTIHLVDSDKLASIAIRHGVGVNHINLAVPTLDQDWFDGSSERG
jgi:hypothetical protein